MLQGWIRTHRTPVDAPVPASVCLTRRAPEAAQAPFRNLTKIKLLCHVFHSRSNAMRASAFPAALTIGIGLAIAASVAGPPAAFASQSPEPEAAVSSAGAGSDQGQLQKFAQWRDRHGAIGDTCLPEPNGAAEPGTRWHYHLDAATQRHCWYQKPVGAAPVAAHVPAAKKSHAQAADSPVAKRHPRALPPAAVERASTVPLTAAQRETLFRQFQHWREDRAPE
jgi:hypothetical protein